MMNEEIVKTLRTKAKDDPIASAMFHVMAYRQRNRHNMTTRGLYYKLRKEGFKYQEKDLVPLFRLLADLGLAKLDVNHRGKVEAIKDFKTPIQKIGEAACTAVGSPEPLTALTNRPTLVSVPKVQAAPIVKVNAAIRAAITLYVNEKPVQINLPEKLSKDELLSILGRFYGV